MIVMYPLKNQRDYTELRYSLRSIEKFLPHDEVVIVAENIPDWIVNITWVKVADIPNRKQWSIRKKILVALEYSEEIFFMNDDIYLLRPMIEIPFYYRGSLKGYAESGAKPLQLQLEAMDKSIKNFDIHYPIMYNKYFFNQASESFTENIIIKSMYGNYHNIIGEEISDCKVHNQKSAQLVKQFMYGKPCLSNSQYSLRIVLPVLQDLFPNPSKYEL